MNIEKYKDIFLDRDGVINEVVIRNGSISSPRSFKEFKLKKDIKNFVKKFENKNFYVVTNQPDISRNLLCLDELQKMHQIIIEELGIKNISFCPHTDEQDCDCRKPKPGMITSYIDEFNLVREKCLMIGDTEKDILAAKNAKISSVLIKTHYNAQLPEINFINSLKDLS